MKRFLVVCIAVVAWGSHAYGAQRLQATSVDAEEHAAQAGGAAGPRRVASGGRAGPPRRTHTSSNRSASTQAAGVDDGSVPSCAMSVARSVNGTTEIGTLCGDF